MKLFLDTSVVLAAGGSVTGASRAIFDWSGSNGWVLVFTSYVLQEIERNLPKLGRDALEAWEVLKLKIKLENDVLTLDRIVVFAVEKDRPILFSALAHADTLLTLDRSDFMSLVGNQFYGVVVATPEMFLVGERANGKLR